MVETVLAAVKGCAIEGNKQNGNKKIELQKEQMSSWDVLTDKLPFRHKKQWTCTVSIGGLSRAVHSIKELKSNSTWKKVLKANAIKTQVNSMSSLNGWHFIFYFRWILTHQ